ncbi:hypothetical protein VE03_09152 [Pseudogymnoascus sp. 23342-1-I1]|nr:hypothetical protein VE03_09152 [Pseudogymnoascus sp. 23342-1-I1]
MSSLAEASQRRRQNLNPLATQLGPPPPQFQAPNSAVTLSSPFHHQTTPYTPASSGVRQQQYNPQQWGGGGGGQQQQTGYSPDNGRYSPSPSDVVMQVQEPSRQRGSMDINRDQPSSSRPRGSMDIRDRDQPSSSHRPPPLNLEQATEAFPAIVAEQRPPASRRAVSASAIGTPSGPSSRSRNSSTSRWEPGMPLPPPPPGPPPQSGSRSQSLSRPEGVDPVVSPPTRRPAPISTLGPVPPTPAGWVDSPRMVPGTRPRSPLPPGALHLDTSSVSSSGHTESNSGSSSSGLTRAHAVRGEPKSIRERRSESRSGKAVAIEEPSNNPWAEAITPADIVVPPMTVLGRRPTIAKSTPSSARSFHNDDTPNSSRTPNNYQSQNTPNSSRTLNHATPRLADIQQQQQPESRGSTPRPLNSATRIEAPTPPFSPAQYPSRNSYQGHNPNIPPKSLPTPPPISRRRADSSPRPISHILHTPLKDQGMPAPLSPKRAPSRQSPSPAAGESFSRAALQRHEHFIQREAAAATDEERIRLFADFIVSESRIRRELYTSAIDAMGSEVLELTRDLFRPYTHSKRNSFGSHHSSTAEHKGPGSLPPLQTGMIDSAPSSASSMGSQGPGSRPESTWWTGYMPSLSPIPSMSASQAQEESSSRGRPSSRWWEVGQSGSGGSPTVLERSKRESKYMGMPRELRESLQWEGNGNTTPSQLPQSSPKAGPSNYASYGADEYPPEKTGWHDEGPISPPHQTPTNHYTHSPAPPTPNPRHLDVSRLVTLPPPYPRHHPAVNNNHPDLTSIRTSVRQLSDFAPVEATKAAFLASDAAARHAAAAAATQRHQTLRATIARDVAGGSMTYAAAAQAESDAALAEHEHTKAASKASFEGFQGAVVAPVNDLLMERVGTATALFAQLRSELFDDARAQDPTATQEEGDEQPELLEKLTLLKWIFEAREQLHGELYDLLSDRNDRYREMVIEPYRLAGREDKVGGAERFFADDAGKRRVEFARGALGRTVEFMDVVEANVVRGVEVQLSAFWDIAPGLRSILDKIPGIVTREFRVQIPAAEYDENPAYHEWPMQYLYSLLEHGGRSTYQFIESQTNLLCLLHEVKTAVTAARARAQEAERVAGGEGEGVVGGEVAREMEAEGRALTEDLKEKVRCVEEQWESALGGELGEVKGRVRAFLEGEGGWEGMEGEA